MNNLKEKRFLISHLIFPATRGLLHTPFSLKKKMHKIKVQRFLISHLLTSFSQQPNRWFSHTHTHIYTQREREREREKEYLLASRSWEKGGQRDIRSLRRRPFGSIRRRFGTEASGVSFRTWRAMGIASEWHRGPETRSTDSDSGSDSAGERGSGKTGSPATLRFGLGFLTPLLCFHVWVIL